MAKESDFSANAKSTPLRAWFYFTANAVYAAAFAVYVFGVWQDSCWTVNGTNVPVTKDTEGAVNTSINWNSTMFVGFIVYSLQAVCSVSQCFTGKWGNRLQSIEKYMAYVCIMMFIALHVTRMTHSGAVCAGDYLTDAEKANNPSGYLIGTGKFLKYFIFVAWITFPTFLLVTLMIYGPQGKIPAQLLDSPK